MTNSSTKTMLVSEKHKPFVLLTSYDILGESENQSNNLILRIDGDLYFLPFENAQLPEKALQILDKSKLIKVTDPEVLKRIRLTHEINNRRQAILKQSKIIAKLIKKLNRLKTNEKNIQSVVIYFIPSKKCFDLKLSKNKPLKICINDIHR